MKNDFKILEELLSGPAAEASGRAAAPISENLREKLNKFVRGELTEEQRKELCVEILREDSALELLAGLIERNRSLETGS
jgi:hypothetical protein